ncbi:MAG: dipeptide ABC transporter ATP-binding protein [Bacteroidota bacterium]
MEMVRIENLSATFGDSCVLKNVSLCLKKNVWLSVVGESGSGKSLTALTMLGLLDNTNIKYTTGSIVVFPPLSSETQEFRNPHDLKTYRGKGIGFIFQEPMTALNPALTCGSQVSEAIPSGIGKTAGKEYVLQLFNEVQLPVPKEVYKKYPHQLSGGQRQRVMIAMALVGNPQLLIADEPTTALDPTVQKAVLDLLKNIQSKREISILFISHDLEAVAIVSDEVIVMQKGQIVEQGRAQEILHNPQHPYTQGLLACKPNRERKGERLMTLKDEFIIKKTYAFSASELSILEVKNVSKQYNNTDHKALNDISFDIKQGQSLALIGESGCGKTTLSKILLGLLPPTAGAVHWKGTELLSSSQPFSKPVRGKIQMVFQDPFASLNPKHTIATTLLETLRVYEPNLSKSQLNERVEILLNEVGMEGDARSKYPHNFSGGQRQRIVIARALASQPELLICDEAVAALDVSVQSQILNLLNELREQKNLSYLFISHDMSVVYHMCDSAMIMQKGEIVESGSISDIFNAPKNQYTQELLRSASMLV